MSSAPEGGTADSQWWNAGACLSDCLVFVTCVVQLTRVTRRSGPRERYPQKRVFFSLLGAAMLARTLWHASNVVPAVGRLRDLPDSLHGTAWAISRCASTLGLVGLLLAYLSVSFFWSRMLGLLVAARGVAVLSRVVVLGTAVSALPAFALYCVLMLTLPVAGRNVVESAMSLLLAVEYVLLSVTLLSLGLAIAANLRSDRLWSRRIALAAVPCCLLLLVRALWDSYRTFPKSVHPDNWVIVPFVVVLETLPALLLISLMWRIPRSRSSELLRNLESGGASTNASVTAADPLLTKQPDPPPPLSRKGQK